MIAERTETAHIHSSHGVRNHSAGYEAGSGNDALPF